MFSLLPALIGVDTDQMESIRQLGNTSEAKMMIEHVSVNQRVSF